MKIPLVRATLPLLLLLAGGFAARWVTQSVPEAKREAPKETLPIVELSQLHAEPRTATLSGTGIVTPAHELNLSPQLSGQVTYVSKNLVPGGRVKRGEVLARIDAREHQLAVSQRRSALRSASLQIEQEQARQALASHEWQAMGETGSASPLFSRESQLAAAQANLDSGSSALQQAELNLDRATLRAPFDATVIRKNVDRGQVVAPGSVLAYLVGTEETWVVVSVRLDELPLLSVPGVGPRAPASKATIRQSLSHGTEIVRQGSVTRLVGQLDAQTRRAQVVTTIEDALSTTDGLPMLPGALVSVAMEGKRFESVYSVPRHAVYEGSHVWIANTASPSGDGPQRRLLESRDLKIAWTDEQNVYATGGLNDGDSLVVTRLANPLKGMAVQSLKEARALDDSPPPVPTTEAKNSPEARDEAASEATP